jgi:Spy/CpxP family protein refolding chaperone
MNRNGLIYLLTFSLSLNLGAIGTFVYLRYGDSQGASLKQEAQPVPLRELWRHLHLNPEQRRALDGLLPEHCQRIRELRTAIALERQQLFEVIPSGEPEWPEVQAKIREINGLQGRLEEEVVLFCLESQKYFNPDQRVAFMNLLERRVHAGKGRLGGPRGPGTN